MHAPHPPLERTSKRMALSDIAHLHPSVHRTAFKLMENSVAYKKHHATEYRPTRRQVYPCVQRRVRSLLAATHSCRFCSESRAFIAYMDGRTNPSFFNRKTFSVNCAYLFPVLFLLPAAICIDVHYNDLGSSSAKNK